MASLLMLDPAPVSAIAASRGSGVANLLSADPKEVWLDSAVGSAATIDLDLGAVRSIDTVFLGSIAAPAAAATWTITGGESAYDTTVLKASGTLRAIDPAGLTPNPSCGFWTGDAVDLRYLRISVTQPAGSPALSAGVAMAGAAFVPTYSKEWGSGRRVIDTGTVTALPGGGFRAVEGGRKGSYSWVLGDLTSEEVDRLYAMQLSRGESLPLLVVEDPAETAGQVYRIHYCRFAGLKQFERRNVAQTRWELTVEDWI